MTTGTHTAVANLLAPNSYQCAGVDMLALGSLRWHAIAGKLAEGGLFY